MTGPALAIQGQSLTKIYGSGNVQVTAMEDVSFSLLSGEVVALLGPSGSGKTTLLTIMGLIMGQLRVNFSKEKHSLQTDLSPKSICEHIVGNLLVLFCKRQV